MRPRMAAALAVAAALVAAAPAQAATLTLVGSKSCYRAGDTLTLNGAGGRVIEPSPRRVIYVGAEIGYRTE